MKILICGDVHFCEFSSIIRKIGDKYSVRLENLIKSVNWVEDQAIKQGCSEIVYLGDFLDRPDLNSREIVALQDINWTNLQHTFLVGNHEASVKSLAYNSAALFKKYNFQVLDKIVSRAEENCDLLFIPYLTEDIRESLQEYYDHFYSQKLPNRKRIVFSHNDIKGIQYGPVLSKEGFDIEDVKNNCNLFINGHIHNGQFFLDSHILNVGNLTGQNFNEDAAQYAHGIYVLDTATNSIEFHQNPYAFNFYKFDIQQLSDISKVSEIKDSAVISIKCKEEFLDQLNQALLTIKDKIIEKRIITIRKISDESAIATNVEAEESTNHLSKFIAFCTQYLENTDILQQELSEVCK